LVVVRLGQTAQALTILLWDMGRLGQTPPPTTTLLLGIRLGIVIVTSNDNTFIGWQAGYSYTGSGNTIIGQYAGHDGTTGVDNTFVGRNAGYLITSGSDNTILGTYNGNSGGLDIRTSKQQHRAIGWGW
jgi:hypothetical protein